MDFSKNEIIIWIIPGLYFGSVILAVAYGLNQIPDFILLLKGDSGNSIASILLFSIPIMGMVMGYIINYLASYVEYLSYSGHCGKKLQRPSAKLLNDKCKRIKISDLQKLKEQLGCLNNEINNDDSKKYLDKAKQELKELSRNDVFYLKSIFARNLLMSHSLLIIPILIMLYCQNFSCFKIASIHECEAYIWVVIYLILGLIYWKAWRRNCIIYVKYYFIEYLHTKKEASQSDNMRRDNRS